MKRTLRIVVPQPEPEPIKKPAPPAGRFMTYREIQQLRQLLINALADYEDVTTEPNATDRIGKGSRHVRAVLRKLG